MKAISSISSHHIRRAHRIPNRSGPSANFRILLISLSIFVYAFPASAVDLLVPTEYRTIQEAIDAAVDGDRILVASGNYNGRGFRGITFEGKAITLQGSSPDDCIIDCEQADRGFDFNRGEGLDSIVRNLQIINGIDACGS